MLVLTRKPKERVILRYKDQAGETQVIVISVNSVDRNKVKLGLEAPKEVVIAREEIADAFKL